MSTANAIFTFNHPFTCVIAGPTQSGKTEFTKKLLKNVETYITPPPTRILWCYGEENQDQMKLLQDACALHIEFIQGIPDMELISSNDTNLIILDDLMVDAGKSVAISNVFTRTSHHQNLSVLLLVQNLFHKGTRMREISLNAKYLVLFKNPRDKGQIRHLAYQIHPQNTNFIVQAFTQATARPHGYLLFDFDQRTHDSRRFLTGIFPPEFPIAFIPKQT